MSRTIGISRRVAAASTGLVLAVVSLAPAILSGSHVSAAQLTERKITMSTSKVSATGATYAVSFKATQTTTVKGIVVQFCTNTPLVGLSCTAASTNSMATPTSGSVTVSNVSGTPASTSFTIDNTNSSSGNKFIITDSTGFTVSTANPITFNITSVTNPSTTGTFYARILTYNSTAGASAYTDTSPGTHLDDGGIALSTANQLTTTARVQEQLSFCVGTTSVNDATTSVASDCSGVSGTTVDLGPISTSTSVSPISVANGGNNTNGVAMVQTNAFNGVNVTYFAEQAGTGTNHLGSLRVAGATCNAGSVNTDQCFNSAGTTQTTFSAGAEDFGMTISGVNCGATTAYTCVFASSSNNLVPTADYNGSGAGTYGTSGGFAWDETGATSSIAASTTVVDNEALIMRFAAQAAITTPTGSYGVTSTYIATATF